MNLNAKPVNSVHYSRTFGPNRSELTAFARGDNSVVYLDYNYDHKPELGFWRRTIPEAQFDELVRRLHASKYEQLEVPAVIGHPGQYPLTIGEQREGEETPTLQICQLDVPQLEPVMQWIAKLTGEVRKSPVRVLRGQARWAMPELRFQRPFEVQITLENVGIEPLHWTHPGDREQTQPALTVYFNESTGGQQGFVVVEATSVVDATPVPRGPAAALGPGEHLTFKARGLVPVEPGEYRGSVFVRSWLPHEDPSALQGQLELDLGPITVR